MNESETQETQNEKILKTEGQKILKGIKDIPLDISEVDKIWDLHPLEMTREQRAVIIEQVRRNREKYQTKKKSAPKAKPVPTGDPKSITLEDLGDLDIDL